MTVASEIHAQFRRQSGSDQIASEFAIHQLQTWLWSHCPRRILEVGAGIGTLSAVISDYLIVFGGHSEAVSVEDDPWCRAQWERNLAWWPAKPILFDKIPPFDFFDFVVLDGDQMPDDGWVCLAAGATVLIEGNRRQQRARLRQYLTNVGRPFCETPSRPQDRSKGIWLIRCEPAWWERVLFFANRIAQWLRDIPARLNGRPIGKRLALLMWAGILMGGCGFFTKPAETITIPLQDARNAYATIRTLYLDGVARIQEKCEKKELTEAECLRLASVADQARRLDFEIRRGLDNPKADVNWENIARFLELAAKFVP